MKVLKALVVSGGMIYKVDAIEHEGKLWLVPNWLDRPSTKETTPGRIIRFDNLRYQDMRGQRSSQADFALNGSVPTELLDIETPKRSIPGFEYIEMPALRRSPGDKSN
jgi:hypothetical protein